MVRSLLVLSDDQVLVGTEEGAAFVTLHGGGAARIAPLVPPPAKRGGRPLDTPMRATWALARTPDGTLFVGTAAGLYFGKNGQFRRAALATGELKDDWVTALAVDGADVYAGTYSGGVTRLRARADRGAIEALGPLHLGGGYVNPSGLTVDRGRLLAATMEGLLARPLAAIPTDPDAAEAAHAADPAAWSPMPKAAPGRDVTAATRFGERLWVASRRGIGAST
jgi:hypothetical protein